MIKSTLSGDAPGHPIDVIYGINGTGKTILSLTGSAQAPAHLGAAIKAPPPDTPMTVIDDMVICAFDKAALNRVAEELRIQVKHFYDFSGLAPEKVFPEFVETMEKDIIPLVAKGGINIVSIDTYSSMETNLKNTIVAPAADTRRAYDVVGGRLGRFTMLIKQLSCRVLLLGHQKDASGEDEAAKRTRLQRGIPEVSWQTIGGGGRALRNDVRFILNLARERQSPKDGGGEKLVLYATRPGYETKRRGGLMLPEKFDGDLRVLDSLLTGS